MNDEKRYETQLRDWKVQHNKVGRQLHRPDHPGPPPVLKNSSELALYEKIIDKSNSTYNITISDGNIKPIRNGIVRWNQNVQYQNYVDLYFIPNSKFAKQHNWENRMMDQFKLWQQQRQNLDLDLSVEMDKDVTMEIFNQRPLVPYE